MGTPEKGGGGHKSAAEPTTTRRQALQKLATGALFPAAVLGISVGEASAKGEGGKDGAVEVSTERDHDRYRAFGGRVANCVLVCSKVVFVMDEVACICGYYCVLHSLCMLCTIILYVCDVHYVYDVMYNGVTERQWRKPFALTANGMYKVSLSRRRSDSPKRFTGCVVSSSCLVCSPSYSNAKLPCTRAVEAGQQAVDLGKGSATQGIRCE